MNSEDITVSVGRSKRKRFLPAFSLKDKPAETNFQPWKWTLHCCPFPMEVRNLESGKVVKDASWGGGSLSNTSFGIRQCSHLTGISKQGGHKLHRCPTTRCRIAFHLPAMSPEDFVSNHEPHS